MILKDISFPSPQDNILYDEVLWSLAEKGRNGETLRFWEAPFPFIVLGRISKEEDDLNIDEIKRSGIPVLRRSSGGGTVIQAPGCLSFALVLSKKNNPLLNDLRKSYQFILGKVAEVLRYHGIHAEFYPISDLAIGDDRKKISGNAQRRGKEFILHHGTILYDFDIALAETFLKMPRQIPEYRASRSHRQFIANVPLKSEQIKTGFREVFRIEKEEHSVSAEERIGLETSVAARPVPLFFTKQ